MPTFSKLIGISLALVLSGTAWAKPYQAIKGQSSLRYTLVHPMHKAIGVSRDFLCQVDLSPDTVSSHIKVSAPVRSFDSGNSNRDSHMLELVEALKYPKVEFASDSVKPEGENYRVSGQVTFHGVTKPISFLVTPHFKGDKVEITGGFPISLAAFKVKPPSLMFVKAHDEVRIDFDLFAPR